MTFGTATGLNTNTYNTGTVKEKIPSGYKKASLQNFTPEQMQLFSSLFGNVGSDSFLSRLAQGDQGIFEQMEAPALRQFSGLQGNIASRFSGAGAGGQGRALGSRNSSGFYNTMNSAASNFAQELQSQRQNLQRQALQDLMGYSKELLGQRPYENFLVQKQQSPWASIVGNLAGAIPGLATSFMGGGSPASALKGASSIFSGGNYNALPGLEDQFRTGQAYL